MSESMTVHIIARIRSDFGAKFGIPRQSGLVDSLTARVIFEPEYRNSDALRGLDGFSHLWLIWQFSQCMGRDWSPTVRPPKLGGNRRMGVFATRSPFRPNPIGLSCVRLERVEQHPALGPVLLVSGADLMDGTPIFDIKPYIPYADCHPDAQAGFTTQLDERMVTVECPPELLNKIPAETQPALLAVLSHDPRPSYQNDPERVYGMAFAGWNVRFRVQKKTLTVCEVEPIKN